MSGLRVSLLGAPRLERDDVSLELRPRKNIALIAYLAVTGQSHSREALITLLWPELEPSRARAGLRRNLSMLRKALGEAWLVVDRESVGLNPQAGFWLDVHRFRSLLRAWQHHGHPESETCSGCLTALAEAVELYRGDFLEGFSLRDSANFDEWQFFQTEGLRQELASVLERLVHGHSTRGAYASAIPYARRWLALYAVASRHPFVANSRWLEDIAGKHIAAVASTLSPDVVAAAQERGRARDLRVTVMELLEELAAQV
jgi:DNA-binding SARP family transcriptional activator